MLATVFLSCGARAQTVAGCYALAYGPVFPDVLDRARPSKYLTPKRLELRSDVDSVRGGDTTRFVSAVPREQERHRVGYASDWRRTTHDSIRVYWDPCMVDGGICLGGQTSFALAWAPDTLRGTADMETDQIPFLGQPWAKVLALRVTCDTADTASWRARTAALSAWAAAEPVDTVLGAARALAGFERNKRDTNGTGPTMFSNLVRWFFAKHGRLPRTAREAYPTDDPVLRRLPSAPFLTNVAGFAYRYVPHGRYFDVIDVGPDGRLGTRNDRVWRHIAAAPAEH